jgi:hypothetical protein
MSQPDVKTVLIEGVVIQSEIRHKHTPVKDVSLQTERAFLNEFGI